MTDAAALPLFNSVEFARELRMALAARPTLADRAAAAEAHVSPATFMRAKNSYADLSHENWLRLQGWLADQRAGRRDAA